MYFQRICTIESKPCDCRPKIKNYPLRMSQKWVILLGNPMTRSGVVHLKKWVKFYVQSGMLSKGLPTRKKTQLIIRYICKASNLQRKKCKSIIYLQFCTSLIANFRQIASMNHPPNSQLYEKRLIFPLIFYSHGF